MNAKDIESARRIIRQFSDGSGRQNSTRRTFGEEIELIEVTQLNAVQRAYLDKITQEVIAGCEEMVRNYQYFQELAASDRLADWHARRAID